MHDRDLQHPDVTSALRTGYPSGHKDREPICPVCGNECEEIYKDRFGRHVGCDVCISTQDAWETPECFP